MVARTQEARMRAEKRGIMVVLSWVWRRARLDVLVVVAGSNDPGKKGSQTAPEEL